MANLGINARALFERSYTEARMLNCYKQLYFDLLTEKCPAGATSAEPGPSLRFSESLERTDHACPGRVCPPRQPKGGGL